MCRMLWEARISASSSRWTTREVFQMDFAMEKTGHFLTTIATSTQFIDLWSLEHKRGKLNGGRPRSPSHRFSPFFIILVVSQGSDFSNPFSSFLFYKVARHRCPYYSSQKVSNIVSTFDDGWLRNMITVIRFRRRITYLCFDCCQRRFSI